MNDWNNAINKEFIDDLIIEIEKLKSELDEQPLSIDKGRYYDAIGKYVCKEIYLLFDKDLEV